MESPPVGIFGGAFDPPHIGHLFSALWAHKIHGLLGVVFIPTLENAFGKAHTAPFNDRVRMVAHLLEDHADWATVSAIESELGTPSRTHRTVTELQKWAGGPIRLVLGSDLKARWHEWENWEQLEAKASPIWINRTGSSEHGIGPALSSTAIRASLQGKTREEADVLRDALGLPKVVLDYIFTNGLYGVQP